MRNGYCDVAPLIGHYAVVLRVMLLMTEVVFQRGDEDEIQMEYQ